MNNSCDFCDFCDYCDYCNYCNFCDYCIYCDFCDFCDYCNYCNYCKKVFYCRNLKMTELNLFCYAEKYNNNDSFQQKKWRVWNKEVSKTRYQEILSKVKEIMCDVKLELNGSDWSYQWAKVPIGIWTDMAKIPEFDKKLTEKIIDNKIDLSEKMEISMDEIAKKFNTPVENLKIKK
jgi:hypothetical protein